VVQLVMMRPGWMDCLVMREATLMMHRQTRMFRSNSVAKVGVM
jgi:hypothetical protein